MTTQETKGDGSAVRSSVESEGLVPKRAKLTARQKRMQKAIDYMRKYMDEYHKQAACLDYSDTTFIDDVLYGLGAALHGTSCRYASGYEAWKKKLREHLKPSNTPISGGTSAALQSSALPIERTQ